MVLPSYRSGRMNVKVIKKKSFDGFKIMITYKHFKMNV